MSIRVEVVKHPIKEDVQTINKKYAGMCCVVEEPEFVCGILGNYLTAGRVVYVTDDEDLAYRYCCERSDIAVVYQACP